MKLPRDISGVDLARALTSLGYVVTRQSGSHMRLSTEMNGTHHITIPAHTPLKIGTMNSILREIAAHHATTREQLIADLFA
jgi:predicted RNA binding protein YcfA (HicA-like mRNA interferase family)